MFDVADTLQTTASDAGVANSPIFFFNITCVCIVKTYLYIALRPKEQRRKKVYLKVEKVYFYETLSDGAADRRVSKRRCKSCSVAPPVGGKHKYQKTILEAFCDIFRRQAE
jgi:hypothetical protein